MIQSNTTTTNKADATNINNNNQDNNIVGVFFNINDTHINTIQVKALIQELKLPMEPTTGNKLVLQALLKLAIK